MKAVASSEMHVMDGANQDEHEQGRMATEELDAGLMCGDIVCQGEDLVQKAEDIAVLEKTERKALVLQSLSRGCYLSFGTAGR